MIRHKFPASLPRKMDWSNKVGDYTICPDCRGPLEFEHHPYVMATRQHGDLDIHMVGNDAGHFCAKCTVVVLDHDEFVRFAALSAGATYGVQFVILGIVDLNAVPEDKRSLPFDDDTNPVPLVKFTNYSCDELPSKSGSIRTRRRKAKKSKKRKRR